MDCEHSCHIQGLEFVQMPKRICILILAYFSMPAALLGNMSNLNMWYNLSHVYAYGDSLEELQKPSAAEIFHSNKTTS